MATLRLIEGTDSETYTVIRSKGPNHAEIIGEDLSAPKADESISRSDDALDLDDEMTALLWRRLQAELEDAAGVSP